MRWLFGWIYQQGQKHVEADKGKKLYDKNKALSRYITGKQMQSVIDVCSDKNYYNLLTNNCTKVATKSWNKAFGNNEFKGSTMTPWSLKKQIGKKDGSFVFDMHRIRGID